MRKADCRETARSRRTFSDYHATLAFGRPFTSATSTPEYSDQEIDAPPIARASFPILRPKQEAFFVGPKEGSQPVGTGAGQPKAAPMAESIMAGNIEALRKQSLPAGDAGLQTIAPGSPLASHRAA